MGCFSQDAPPPVNYADQTQQTLQAQINLAPQQFASEATYQPQYTNLALSNINNLLNGTPGGSKSVDTMHTAGDAGWYDPSGTFVSRGQFVPGKVAIDPNLSPLARGAAMAAAQANGTGPYYTPGTMPGAGDTWQNAGSDFHTQATINTPATPGLTSVLAGANTAQRQSDINDVTNLGPQARAAMLNANPDQAALLGTLNQQANDELAAGSSLTPDQIRAMQQASRAAFAARGMSGSNAGISDELLRQYNLGNQMLMQRQQFAQSVLGNNAAVVGDPFMSILGRSSGAIGTAQGIAQNSGPSLFNPESALSGQITAGNQQMAAAFAAPSIMSDVGTSVGIAGKLVGGIASAY